MTKYKNHDGFIRAHKAVQKAINETRPYEASLLVNNLINNLEELLEGEDV